MIAPQFEACDGTQINLTSIIPTGVNIYGVAVARLTAYGTAAASYAYTDCGGDSEEEIGWVDGANNMITDVTLKPGEGLWVTGTGITEALQSSGAVRKEDSQVQLRLGSTPAGNPYPVAIEIQDILPEGKKGASVIGIALAKLSAYGTADASYAFTDCGGDSEEEIGWVDGANNMTEDVVLPGEGLWITAQNTDQWITFPAPECLTEDK